MRDHDDSPNAKSGGNNHHFGRIAARQLFRDADNVRGNEATELAYRVEGILTSNGRVTAS